MMTMPGVGWAEGGQNLAAPAAKLWKFQILDNLGFRQKGDRFVEVCPGGWVGPDCRGHSSSGADCQSLIQLLCSGSHLPVYNTMCSKLIEWWYDLELCEQIMLIHCWYNSDGANLPVRHLPICSIPTNNFLPEPSTRALYVTIRHYY